MTFAPRRPVLPSPRHLRDATDGKNAEFLWRFDGRIPMVTKTQHVVLTE